MGSNFVLRTYHHSLKDLFEQLNLNLKQERWMEFLSKFDFNIQHIKGKENIVSYALRRKGKCMQVSPINTWKSKLKESC